MIYKGDVVEKGTYVSTLSYKINSILLTYQNYLKNKVSRRFLYVMYQ